MKKDLFFVYPALLLLSLPLSSICQTGPGGVGSSATLQVWLDASQLSLSNGASVNTFTDVSGNGNNFTGVNAPTFATNQINSLPAVDFDGVNDFMQSSPIAAFNSETEFSWFVIGQGDIGGQNGVFVSNLFGGSNNGQKWISRVLTGNVQNLARVSASFVNQSTSFTAGFHSLSSTWNMTTGAFSSRKDNTQYATTNTATSTNGAHLRTILGRNSSASSGFLNGKIAETLIYNVALNTTQVNLVNNYLGAKYNLTIGSDKYAFQATHGNEVAGIGQETASDNHLDAQGTGEVRINAAVGLTDGEYMLWGHNGGSTGSNGTEVPIAGALKLIREWRVDISGGDNALTSETVVFDLTGISFGVDPTQYDIWIDSDGDFTDAIPQNLTPSVAGSIITFTGVTLSDGDFFTIANSQVVQVCASLNSGDWQAVVWDCGAAPDSTNDVIISDGTAVSISGTETANDLTIEADAGGGGGNLSLAANTTLVVKGDLTVEANGTITFGAGSTLIIRSITAAQTFANNSGLAITLSNVEINNVLGVTLSGSAMELTEGLTLTNGDLTNDVDFSFRSDASGTARINAIPNGSTLNGSGTFTVQRFRSTRTANWGNIASSGVQTTLEDLDNEIFISGIVGGDGNAQQTGGGVFVSVWSWNESGSPDDYVSPASTGDPFEIGRGYEVWLADNLTTWGDQAWDLTGNIDVSPVSITVNSSDSRWNLIGNPYPGFLDWDHITLASGGIDNDEYWYYDAATSAYVSVSSGGTAIAPGQGMWVQTTGINSIDLDPTIDLLSNVSTSTMLKKPSTTYDQLEVHLERTDKLFGSSAYLRKHEGAFVGKDEMDASPLRLPDPRACNISIDNGTDKSMVNYLPTSDDRLEIPLIVEAGMEGEFEISLRGLDKFNEYECINLVDQQSGESISLMGGSTYTFKTGESLADRFMKLILTKNDYDDCIAPSEMEEGMIRIWGAGKTINADFYLSQPANSQLDIYNVLGERVYSSTDIVGFNRKAISMDDVEAGVYLVNIQVNGSMVTEKIVLQ